MAEEPAPSLGRFGSKGHNYSDIDISGEARAHLGDSITQIQLPERKKTPPSPFNVPFPRDPDFVDCGHIDVLKDRLSHGEARIALVGIGGVGKSQIAIEYCRQLRKQSPQSWTLWIHASNATRFEQSVHEIVDQLDLPGREDPKAKMLQLLRKWLSAKNGSWLIVLDNADNTNFLVERRSADNGTHGDQQHGATGPALIEYFPFCSHGSVLITSRNNAAARRLVEDNDILTVDPMEAKHAVKLLHRKLHRKKSKEQYFQENLPKLAEALEFMPLAITQAASFINRKNMRCSVDEYLQKLQHNDLKSILLCGDEGDLRRDSDAKNSILLTWQISFNDVREMHPNAAKLLSVMSFFDRLAIPADVLRGHCRDSTKYEQQDRMFNSPRDSTKASDWDEFSPERLEMVLGMPVERVINFTGTDRNDENFDSDDEDGNDEAKTRHGEMKMNLEKVGYDDNFEEHVDVLLDYSFISASENGKSFDMHRLVQFATRMWLYDQSQLEQWKKVFVVRLFAAFPSGQYGTWAECQRLFPHAMASLSHEPVNRDVRMFWACLLSLAAAYMCHRGWPEEAVELYTRAAEASKAEVGPDARSTLVMMGNLENTLRTCGRLKKAEDIQKSVLKAKQVSLGEYHPDTVHSKYELGLTFRDQCRLQEAGDLLKTVVQNARILFGPDTEILYRYMSGLSWIYRELEQWDAAEKLDSEVLEKMKHIFEENHPNHPSIISSMTAMAMSYKGQGRLEEAQKLYEHALEKTRLVYEPENVSRQTTVVNLADTYYKLQRWEDAEKLQIEVMATRKKVRGAEHPDTVDIMDRLAQTYVSSRKFDKGEHLLHQVIEIKKKLLGAEHDNTIRSMSELTYTYIESGKLEKAEELLTKEKLSGAAYQHVLQAVENRAWDLYRRGQTQSAFDLMRKCESFSAQTLGNDHRLTIQRRVYLRDLYQRLQK